jgi:uncharacterized protein YqgV (UPF0045/DUF77 family)
MLASAQVAIYPLRQARLSPAVEAVRVALVSAGLHSETGPMSTVVTGEVECLFAALQAAFVRAAVHGPVVLTVTLSNACPVDVTPPA